MPTIGCEDGAVSSPSTGGGWATATSCEGIFKKCLHHGFPYACIRIKLCILAVDEFNQPERLHKKTIFVG